MNVQELRYVVAVAQAGSINKAALNLYVSQSTLSRAVQEVEAQIGISLFQRTNKGAIPTHDGLEFIERARRLLLAFDQLEGQYFNHEKAEQETLLVATQRCTPVISAFIEYYQKRCEDKKLLNLALKEDTTDNIIRLVSNRIYERPGVLVPAQMQKRRSRDAPARGEPGCGAGPVRSSAGKPEIDSRA